MICSVKICRHTYQDVGLHPLDDLLRDVVLVVLKEAVQELAGVCQQLLGRIPVVWNLQAVGSGTPVVKLSVDLNKPMNICIQLDQAPLGPILC